MPKVRIKEMNGRPAVPAVSLGGPRNRLVPGETADVSDEVADILCREGGPCERVAGRPKRKPKDEPETATAEPEGGETD